MKENFYMLACDVHCEEMWVKLARKQEGKKMERPQQKQKSAVFDILKVMACLLITNSHCREIYPWFFLAIGGGHGNSLFFIISGFLLAKINVPFVEWIKKRVRRILPITIGFALVSALLIDRFDLTNGIAVLWFYINKYWFVAAILLYYFVYYFIFAKWISKLKWVFVAYILGYILLYLFAVDKNVFGVELEGFSLIKVYFYLGVFLAGGMSRWLLEKYETLLMKNINKVRIGMIVLIVASCIIWVGEYALVMLLKKGYMFQFLIHLSVFVFSVSMLTFAYTFRQFVMPRNWFGKVLTYIASSTLEIYLVQVTIQPCIRYFSFPINWMAFFGLAIGGGVLVHAVIEKGGVLFGKNAFL